MNLTKKRWNREKKIGAKRQRQGKYPVGLFPDRGVPAARWAGARQEKARTRKHK
jgi:hypothetical protein